MTNLRTRKPQTLGISFLGTCFAIIGTGRIWKFQQSLQVPLTPSSAIPLQTRERCRMACREFTWNELAKVVEMPVPILATRPAGRSSNRIPSLNPIYLQQCPSGLDFPRHTWRSSRPWGLDHACPGDHSSHLPSRVPPQLRGPEQKKEARSLDEILVGSE